MKKLIKEVALKCTSKSLSIIDKSIMVRDGKSFVTDLDTFICFNFPYSESEGVYNTLGIKFNEVENFPWIHKETFNPIGEIKAATFNSFSSYTPFMGKDEIRPIFNTLYFDAEKLVATDAWAMIFDSHNEQLKETFNIPAKSIQFIKMLKAENSVNVSKSSAYVCFDLGEIQIYSKFVDADFPKYQNVIPCKDDFETKIVIPKADILKAIKEAKQADITFAHIEINIEAKQAILQNVDFNYSKTFPIEVYNETPTEINGLIMPCVATGENYGIGLLNFTRSIDTLYLHSQNKAMLFNTNSKPITPRKNITIMETKKAIAAPCGSKITIEVVNYSEKALGIFGETKAIKEKLKEMGCKFNPYLTHEGTKKAGWIVSKKHEAEVKAFVATL